MNRSSATLLALLFLAVEVGGPLSLVRGESSPDAGGVKSMDLFDAMQQGAVEAKFVPRNSKRGRIIMENKTDQPVSIEIPDAFIGVPLAQMGGMGGGGGGMGGGMGGGQQSVGGGGGGGGGRGGGGRGGGFNIPPEKIVRVDVPLLCLDHGLEEPSSSNPYAIRPIENFVKDPAVIEIVAAYANGDLPTGAAQAAVWNVNSEVSWEELSSKLTGTKRQAVRAPYFSGEEIQGAMAIVAQARQATAGKEVEPREFKLPGEKSADETDASEIVSPGDEASPGEAVNEAADEESAEESKAEDDNADAPKAEADKKAA